MASVGGVAAVVTAEAALRPTTVGVGAQLPVSTGDSELQPGVVEAAVGSTLLVRLQTGLPVHVNLADSDVVSWPGRDVGYVAGDRVVVEIRDHEAIGVATSFEDVEGPIQRVRDDAIEVGGTWYVVPPDFHTTTEPDTRIGPIERGDLRSGKSVALRALYNQAQDQYVVRHLSSVAG